MVSKYIKPVVMEKVDLCQFGAVPHSNTTYTLITMIHSWSKSTDGNSSTTRVILFDFKKAFDLIDHCILDKKLSDFNFAHRIVCWIVNFLIGQKQRVKLSSDCYLEWGAVTAGIPQGTKHGFPQQLKLMIFN